MQKFLTTFLFLLSLQILPHQAYAQDFDSDGLPDTYELDQGYDPNRYTKIFHVDGSALDDTGSGLATDSPKKYISSGVALAKQDDSVENVVLVADGTYTGALNRNLDFEGHNIKLRSMNGASKTIVDCELTDNERFLKLGGGEDRSSWLDGFTIRNSRYSAGAPLGYLLSDTGYSGGAEGRYLPAGQYNGKSYFKHESREFYLFWSNNYGYGYWFISYGGMYDWESGWPEYYAYSSSDTPPLTGWYSSNYYSGCSMSAIFDNHGSALTLRNSSITVRNCVFHNNASGGNGGAVYAENSSSLFENCIFSGGVSQLSGGAFSAKAGSIEFKRCSFDGNSAVEYGGALSLSGTGQANFENCLFIRNRADIDGGAAYVADALSTSSFKNCTVVSNSSYGIHKGIASLSLASAKVDNSIIRDFSLLGGHDNAEPPVNNSCMYPGFSGEGSGNFTDDPQLTLDGFLKVASPCINAGNLATAPSADIHGQPRPFGSGVDIGCDEFTDSDADGLPNWFETASGGDISAAADIDGDALSNLDEYAYGLDPLLPDTDGDQLNDGVEVVNGYDPSNGTHLFFVNGVMLDDTGDGLTASSAKKYISSAVALAKQQDDGRSEYIVIVADGAYTGAQNRNLDFDGHGIWLRSANGPAATAIDCEGADNARVLISKKPGDSRGCLDGFTLRNGLIASSGGGLTSVAGYIVHGGGLPDATGRYAYAGQLNGKNYFKHETNDYYLYWTSNYTGVWYINMGNTVDDDGNTEYYYYGTDADAPPLTGWEGNYTNPPSSLEPFYRNNGACVYIENSSITLRNCILENNSSQDPDGGGYGGAVFAYNSSSLIENCVFRSNLAKFDGGACYIGGGRPLLKKCSFSGNSAQTGSGGAIHVQNGAFAGIEGCTFVGNSSAASGGALNSNAATASIRTSIMTGNQAGTQGGAIALSGTGASALLENCVLLRNQATADAGAIYCDNAGISISLMNCTAAFNLGGGTYPGIYSAGNANVTNSIVSDNSYFGGSSSANYSSMFSGFAGSGTGNITGDPQLTAEGYLLPTSPCIDTGTATGAPERDLAGSARYDHPNHPNTSSIVDIGAYEFVEQMPDIQVVSPRLDRNTVKRGQQLTVSWQVFNSGSMSTVSDWKDAVYFSRDTVLDGNDILGILMDSTPLPAQSSYSRQTVVTIPQSFAGDYHVLVKADSLGQMLEGNEQNNVADAGIVSATDTQNPTISITAAPAGGSTIMPGVFRFKWEGYDSSLDPLSFAYVLSNDQNADPSTQPFTATTQVDIQLAEDGAYYFKVVAKDHTGNMSPVASRQFAVDGTPPQITSVNPGASISTPLATIQLTFSENVPLAAIADISLTGPSGQSIAATAATRISANVWQFTFPRQFQVGTYSFTVSQNIKDAVGNRMASDFQGSITVSLPNLTGLSLSVPAQVAAGTSAAVSWTDRNAGNAATSGTWTDRIYISNDNTLSSNDTLLGEKAGPSSSLAPSENFQSSASVTVPQLTAGTYYVIVCIDAGASVDENSESDNTVSASLTVRNMNLAVADSSISVPQTSNIGDRVTATWRATNTSEDSIAMAPWDDAVYISSNAVFGDSDDALLATSPRTTNLSTGTSYNANATFNVPTNLTAGTYTIFVKANYLGSLPESNMADNVKSTTINITRKFALLIARQGEGQVELKIGNGDYALIQLPYSAMFDDGTSVSLRETPATEWHFLSWQGSLTGAEQEKSLTINAATSLTAAFQKILTNPANITAVPGDAQVSLAWDAVETFNVLKEYRIYCGEGSVPFTSVEGMIPVKTVSGAASATVTGLTNRTQYQFAVTSVNVSDVERKTVASVSATPRGDEAGPVLTSVKWNSTEIAADAANTISSTGSFVISAYDETAIGRIELHLTDNTTSTVLPVITASKASNTYIAEWNNTAFADGDGFTLVIKLYDTLGNETVKTRAFTLNLGQAPPAPAITQPADNSLTNNRSVSLSGTSDKYLEIVISIGTSVLPQTALADKDGKFTLTFDLPSDGTHSVTAKARYPGRTDLSASSGAVQITLDTVPPVFAVTSPAASAVDSPSLSFKLSGTKEAGAGISLNSVQIVPAGLQAATWEYSTPLNPAGDTAFSITSNDMAGNVSAAQNFTVRYVDIPPVTVDNFALTATPEGESAVINWNVYRQAESHGDIAQYLVYYSTSDFSSVSGLVPVAVNSSVSTATAANLQKNAGYWFAVIAKDMAGNLSAVSTKFHQLADTDAPADVRNIRAESAADTVTLSWDPSTSTDKQDYAIYLDGAATPELVPAATNTYVKSSLAEATSFNFKVATRDTSGNESAGVQVEGITWLQNPSGLAADPRDAKAMLSWNPVSSPLIKEYHVYAATQNRRDITGMAPRLRTTSASSVLNGLVNNTEYYVAVTAVSRSGSERPQVTAVKVVPRPDTVGPVVENVKFDGSPISGITVTKHGTISYDAHDETGIQRIEAYLGSTLINTDSSGLTSSSFFWNISNVSDGSHVLRLKSYDTLNNTSTLDIGLNVAMAIPDAVPVFTSPANGCQTNKTTVTVTGSAQVQAPTDLLLYVSTNDDAETSTTIKTTAGGAFTAQLTLFENKINKIQAALRNRAGTGPRTPVLLVQVDTSIPNPPTGLRAYTRSSGQIELFWVQPIGETSVKGYSVYRASGDSPVAPSSPVTTSYVTATNYLDLTSSDASYAYWVTVTDLAGNESALSAPATVSSDSQPPTIVDMKIIPESGKFIPNAQGLYVPAESRIAPSNVRIEITLGERISSPIYLALTPEGGFPTSIEMTLADQNTNKYTGTLEIKSATPSGKAYFVFSARDAAGNRGTEIPAACRYIVIDTAGPEVIGISLNLVPPILNSPANPPLLEAIVGLNEQVSGTPSLSITTSRQGYVPVPVTSLVKTETLAGHRETWKASFTLPSDLGQSTPETFSFVWSALDDLGNRGAAVRASNNFQVYQGDLPPLDIPSNFKGKALPGAHLLLSWNAVSGAGGYRLFREDTSTGATVTIEVGNTLSYEDVPPADGTYRYRVASLRFHNNQVSQSGMSSAVELQADSQVPPTPEGLALVLKAQYIEISFNQSPADSGVVGYNIYRSSSGSGSSISTPYMAGVLKSPVYDVSPSATDHYYAVSAVDAVGNESAPSEWVYINPGLLPVDSIHIVQSNSNPPEISWTHPRSSFISGYSFYSGATPASIARIQDISVTSMTDSGYNGTERHYGIKAVDGSSESLMRTIALPNLKFTPVSDQDVPRILRGVMNRIRYKVENSSTFDLENVQLTTVLDRNGLNKPHVSDTFTIHAGETVDVPVVVGGYLELPATVDVRTTASYKPISTEAVDIIRDIQMPVGNASLSVQISTDPFTRGATGKAYFTLKNTSSEQLEIITARSGSASPDIRFLLYDNDNNLLSTVYLSDPVGDKLVSLANGDIVARLESGESYSSDAVELQVPLVKSSQLKLVLDVAHIYYNRSKPTEVMMGGFSTSDTVTLVDTSYSGIIDTVTPLHSSGNSPIAFIGHAVSSRDGSPVGSAKLKLMIFLNDFRRDYDVVTSTDGTFQFSFTPQANEYGSYTAKIAHPDLTSVPREGTQFFIEKSFISPQVFNLSLPRNTPKAYQVTVQNGEGTVLDQVKLLYRANDQPYSILPQGVKISVIPPVNVGSAEKKAITFTITADSSSAQEVSLILALVQGASEQVLKYITVNASFTDAVPVLNWSPAIIETGVTKGTIQSSSLSIKNNGLKILQNVRISLVPAANSSVPPWVYLNTLASLGDIAIGESKNIEFSFAPPDNSSVIPATWYDFNLKIESDNLETQTVQGHAYVAAILAPGETPTDSAAFKLQDIYTATLKKDSSGNVVRDAEGNPVVIQGLAGATVKIEHQTENLTKTAVSDVNGDILFTNLLPGFYKYTANANNHNTRIGSFWVMPGIMANVVAFLDYNMISVQWEVTEVPVIDQYDITLNFTYEVKITTTYLDNAPAAVVVVEPGVINVPQMQKGDVFRGELTYTNYGLIRADRVRISAPPENANFRYEIMTESVPEYIESKQRITVPYKITCLETPNSGAASGGGVNGDPNISLLHEYEVPCDPGRPISGETDTPINHYAAINQAFAAIGDPINSILDAMNAYTSTQDSGTQGTSGGTGSSGFTPGSSTGNTDAERGATNLGGEKKCFAKVKCNEKTGNIFTDIYDAIGTFLRRIGSDVFKHSGIYYDTVGTMTADVGGEKIVVERIYDGERWLPLFQNTMKFDLGDGSYYDDTSLIFKSFALRCSNLYENREYYLHRMVENMEVEGGTPAQYSDVVITYVYEYWDPTVVLNGILYSLPKISPFKVKRILVYMDGEYIGDKAYTHYITSPVELVSEKGYSRITFSQTGYTYSNLDGEFKNFDWKGRVLAVGSYKSGISYTIDRDNSGEPTAVKDRTGAVLFTLSTIDNIQTITDANGATVQYIKNEQGLLGEVRESTGTDTVNVSKYEYNANNLISRKIEPNGKIRNITYDKNNRVAGVKDENGVGYTLEYDFDSNKRLVYCLTKTPEGSVEETWVDLGGKVSRYDVNGRTVFRAVRSTDDRINTYINEKNKAITVVNDEFQNPIRVTYPDGTSETFKYATKFRNLISHIDQKGNQTVYTYDDKGNIATMVEASGTPVARTTEYFHERADFPALITKIGKSGGATPGAMAAGADLPVETSFAYDDRGRLIKVTDPLGNATEVTQYSQKGDVLQVKNSLGKLISFEYDAKGRIAKVTDPLNNIVRTEYDPAGKVSAEIDALNRRTIMSYDREGNMLSIKDAMQNVSSATYNKLNLPLSIVDAEGNETKYEYDVEGNILKETDPEGYVITYEYDDMKATSTPSSQPYRINYPTWSRQLYCDANGQIIKTVDSPKTESGEVPPAGQCAYAEFTYDSAGLLSTRKDSRGLVTTYAYDALNRIISEVSLVNGEPRTVSYAYDSRDNLVSLTDAVGRKTSLEYDKLDRVVKRADCFGKTISLDYNATGQPILATDHYGRKITMTYDDAGRLLSRSFFARGAQVSFRTITYTYDAVGKVVSAQETKAEGNVQLELAYDDLDRQISSTLTSDNQALATGFSYNPTGTLKTFTDEDGAVSEFLYDKLGRTTKHTRNDGTVSTWKYGPLGLTFAQDPSGRVTEYSYDAFGRSKTRKDAKGGIFAYAYSSAGDLLQFTDSNNNMTKWAYDVRGRVTSKTYADNSVYQYTYSPAGLLLSRQDARGRTTSYTYNVNGQITGVDYPQSPDISYAYNPDGTLASVTDAVGTTSLTYDESGRISSENGPFDNDTIERSYDAFDRMLSFTLKSDNATPRTASSYAYDSIERLKSVTSAGTEHKYSFRGSSYQITQIKRNSKTVVSNTYDLLKRMTSKQNLAASSGNILSSYSLEYNNSDEIIRKTENTGKVSAYAYDSVGQLVSANKTDNGGVLIDTASYSYDPMGNRLSSSSLLPDASLPVASSYTPNSLNQYSEIFKSDGTSSAITYDENGNTASCPLSSGVWNMIWDDENQLISTTNASNGTKLEYAYDYLGRRRIKTSYSYDLALGSWTPQARTEYIYKGWDLVEKRECLAQPFSPTTSTYYTWGLGAGGVGGLLSVKMNSGTYFPQYDDNGNVVSYTDENDNVLAEYEYSPFGKIISQSGSMADEFDFRFSTRQFDTETGLIYYGFRYYSPDLGRWMSRDPIGELGGVNLYGFVGNDPVNGFDVLGLKSWWWEDIWTAANNPGQVFDRDVANAALRGGNAMVKVIGGAAEATAGAFITVKTLGLGAVPGGAMVIDGSSRMSGGFSDFVNAFRDLDDQIPNADYVETAFQKMLRDEAAGTSARESVSIVLTMGTNYIYSKPPPLKIVKCESGACDAAKKAAENVPKKAPPKQLPAAPDNRLLPAPKDPPLYRAIDELYADSTVKSGQFYRSGAKGRLGNDGIYVNSTVEGAIAE